MNWLDNTQKWETPSPRDDFTHTQIHWDVLLAGLDIGTITHTWSRDDSTQPTFTRSAPAYWCTFNDIKSENTPRLAQCKITFKQTRSWQESALLHLDLFASSSEHMGCDKDRSDTVYLHWQRVLKCQAPHMTPWCRQSRNWMSLDRTWPALCEQKKLESAFRVVCKLSGLDVSAVQERLIAAHCARHGGINGLGLTQGMCRIELVSIISHTHNNTLSGATKDPNTWYTGTIQKTGAQSMSTWLVKFKNCVRLEQFPRSRLCAEPEGHTTQHRGQDTWTKHSWIRRQRCNYTIFQLSDWHHSL